MPPRKLYDAEAEPKGSGLEKRLMRLGGGFGNNRHGEVESLLLLDLKAEVELASGAVAAAAPRK